MYHSGQALPMHAHLGVCLAGTTFPVRLYDLPCSTRNSRLCFHLSAVYVQKPYVKKGDASI